MFSINIGMPKWNDIMEGQKSMRVRITQRVWKFFVFFFWKKRAFHITNALKKIIIYQPMLSTEWSVIYIIILWCGVPKSPFVVVFSLSLFLLVCACACQIRRNTTIKEASEKKPTEIDHRNVIDYIANVCIRCTRFCLLCILILALNVVRLLHDDYDVCT